MSERATPTPGPGRRILMQDALSFVLGWALAGYEVLTRDQVRESVLLFAGLAVGFPGLALGASSLVDAVRSRAGTPPPSESSPPVPSPPSPPS